MERRRCSNRRAVLETVLQCVASFLFVPSQVPITGSDVNYKDIEWATAGSHSSKSWKIYPPDSGQKSINLRAAGSGQARGEDGGTGTSNCSAAPFMPTDCRGSCRLGPFPKGSWSYITATTRHAFAPTTYFLERPQITSGTWTPKEDEGKEGQAPCTSLVNSTEVPSVRCSRTRQKISEHELVLQLVFRAVNTLQLRVLAHLERAEFGEPDAWLREDLRTAQLVLILAAEGVRHPYSKAFFKQYGKWASDITWWWRNRSILYGICESGYCTTPLMRPDLAREIIPDYDYSQASAVPPRSHPPNKPAASLALTPGGSARPGAAGRKKAL